jgi:hypothetical protein
VRKWHHNRENNEVVEFSVLHEDIREFVFLRKSACILNWTAVDVGEPGSGQVRLRQTAAGLN